MLANPNLTQPLVVRANVGDCIKVMLRNDLTRRVGIHPDGLVQLDPEDIRRRARRQQPRHAPSPPGGRPPTPGTPTSRARRRSATSPTSTPPTRGTPPSSTASTAPSSSTPRARCGTTRSPATTCSTGRPRGRDAGFRRRRHPDRGAALVRHGVHGRERGRQGPQRQPADLPDHRPAGLDLRHQLPRRAAAQPAAGDLEHRGTVTPENPDGVARTITLPNGNVFTPDDHFCDGYVPELDQVVDDPGASASTRSRTCSRGSSATRASSCAGRGRQPRRRLRQPHPQGLRRRPGAVPRHPPRRQGEPPVAPAHPALVQGPEQPGLPAQRRAVRSAPARATGWSSRAAPAARSAPSATRSSTATSTRTSPRACGATCGSSTGCGTAPRSTPDGTPIQALRELPDRAGQTPAPTADAARLPAVRQGRPRPARLPRAVRGHQGRLRRRCAAPVTRRARPTALEAASLPALNATKPGHGYIDPCPTGAPTRVYRPHVDRRPRSPTTAPAGRTGRAGCTSRSAKAAAVRAGTEQPEPYTIRARLGECVQVFTTNDLHLDDDPSVPLDHVNRLDGDYMEEEETSEVSTHVHLVKFDELASDGTSVGWNYSSRRRCPGRPTGTAGSSTSRCARSSSTTTSTPTCTSRRACSRR